MDTITKASTIDGKFVSVYIGPVDASSAEAVMEDLIRELAAEHRGIKTTHLTGMTYSKSVLKGSEGVKVFDYQRKMLTYYFDDARMAHLLLGRDEQGREVKEEIIDPNFISHDPEFDSDLVGLSQALGLGNDTSYYPMLWHRIPVQDTHAKKPTIKISRPARSIEIQMTPEIAQMRSLERDNDRFGTVFHTRLTPLRIFDIGPEFEEKKLKISNVFTAQVIPGENADLQYLQRNRAHVLNHLKNINEGRAVQIISEADGSMVVEFSSRTNALIALNLKGPGINVGTLHVRNRAESTRTSTRGRGGSSVRGSSRAPSSSRGESRDGSSWRRNR